MTWWPCRSSSSGFRAGTCHDKRAKETVANARQTPSDAHGSLPHPPQDGGRHLRGWKDGAGDRLYDFHTAAHPHLRHSQTAGPEDYHCGEDGN